MRVGLLTGCVQNVLAPQINRATIRLLNRLRAEVVVPDGVGCCGALTHHMGREADSSPLMLANIRAFRAEMQAQGLDAIVANASGCGTQLKDYGFIFRLDPAWAEPAAEVSSLARDITEVVAELGLPPGQSFPKMSLAYQSACSLKNGQKIEDLPIQLLERSGFSVRVVPEGHMCCGSAGTYNLLQPDIAERLRRRKIEAIKSLGSDAVAAGNIGCIVQLGRDNEIPIAHTVEFLDWATGGPKPVGLGG
jgi:glycolate oxidase iron-sulfur subunit